MNLQKLSEYLLEECYQPFSYHIGPGWESCGDTICINRARDKFEVFYVERGERGKTFHIGENESDACKEFLSILDREPFSKAHCVGFFSMESDADRLAERLISGGIQIRKDAIPYGSLSDKRFQIFVFGRDKTHANKIMGSHVPLADNSRENLGPSI
jgi:hypothetical protein